MATKSKPNLSELLYDACIKDAAISNEGPKKVFDQDALVALCDSEPLNVLQDVHNLLPVIEKLAADGLFIFAKIKDRRCWSLRPREAAAKVRILGQDERMVYGLVEEAGQTGIWIRNLKAKTGIKDGKAMDKIINKLQAQELIKNVKNIKAPAQKTYVLFHLAASSEVTGGSFYDGGDLDDSLVEDLGNFIVFHVRQMSWVDEKQKHVKRETSPIVILDDVNDSIEGAPAPRPTNKRKRNSHTSARPNDIEDMAPPAKRRSSNRQLHGLGADTFYEQIPFPAGHEYPTATSIHHFITSNDIIRAVKASSLTVNEVQNILNILVWDEKLERVNGGYRTVRGVKFKQPGEFDDPEEELVRKRGNGLTEMPCGQCPVIDLCGDGGPVNATSCVYFTRWLGQEVAG